jgi:hypothetical protein
VGGFQHLLDPRRVLHVGRDQPARERLALDVGGALRLQPLDRHVEGLAHRAEHEIEAP